MIGRLLACKMLGERRTHASVEMLSQTLTLDPFFGVRIAAARALAKHDTDEAHEVLRVNINQNDARVRQQVVTTVVNRFHPDTPAQIDNILQDEKNPMIQAVAIRGWGRFHGQASRKALIKYLKSTSFRNELADAAINAMRQQNDASYGKALMRVLREHEDRFTSRGFGQGLGTLAHVSKTN